MAEVLTQSYIKNGDRKNRLSESFLKILGGGLSFCGEAVSPWGDTVLFG